MIGCLGTIVIGMIRKRCTVGILVFKKTCGMMESNRRRYRHDTTSHAITPFTNCGETQMELGST
jgi:hypothetical protein